MTSFAMFRRVYEPRGLLGREASAVDLGMPRARLAGPGDGAPDPLLELDLGPPAEELLGALDGRPGRGSVAGGGGVPLEPERLARVLLDESDHVAHRAPLAAAQVHEVVLARSDPLG